MSGITRSDCKQRCQEPLLKQQEKAMERKEEDSGWLEQVKHKIGKNMKSGTKAKVKLEGKVERNSIGEKVIITII